mmetsp:Transcript_75553/g.172933  ORF Transcript_75553/g.172933 Transcript_75553/m.172933 type:complete len:263 (-) Transcript_75553:193-981(-)
MRPSPTVRTKRALSLAFSSLTRCASFPLIFCGPPDGPVSRGRMGRNRSTMPGRLGEMDTSWERTSRRATTLIGRLLPDCGLSSSTTAHDTRAADRKRLWSSSTRHMSLGSCACRYICSDACIDTLSSSVPCISSTTAPQSRANWKAAIKSTRVAGILSGGSPHTLELGPTVADASRMTPARLSRVLVWRHHAKVPSTAAPPKEYPQRNTREGLHDCTTARMSSMASSMAAATFSIVRSAGKQRHASLTTRVIDKSTASATLL